MLCIVVVPRDPVIVEKSEQLVSVLLQACLDFHRFLTLQVAFRDLPIESLGRREVLRQKAAFQAVSINCFHHGLEQDRKVPRDLSQFFVERVLQNIVVQVPYQVNQAFLLRTLNCIIGGIKIRHQDAFEVFQHGLDQVPLSRVAIDIGNILHIGEYPHESVFVPEFNLRFIDVK